MILKRQRKKRILLLRRLLPVARVPLTILAGRLTTTHSLQLVFFLIFIATATTTTRSIIATTSSSSSSRSRVSALFVVPTTTTTTTTTFRRRFPTSGGSCCCSSTRPNTGTIPRTDQLGRPLSMLRAFSSSTETAGSITTRSSGGGSSSSSSSIRRGLRFLSSSKLYPDRIIGASYRPSAATATTAFASRFNMQQQQQQQQRRYKAQTMSFSSESSSSTSSSFYEDDAEFIVQELIDDGVDDNDYSFENLQVRIERFVQEQQQQRASTNPGGGGRRFAVAIAGGGGHFVSTLASTPGASRAFLEGTVCYDHESYRQYVARATAALTDRLERLRYFDTLFDRGEDGTSPNRDKFRYASMEAAQYAAEAAYVRALQLSALGDTNPLEDMASSTGVGCASALRSNDSKSRTSRAFVAVQRPRDGSLVKLQATLCRETGRTRVQEDVFVAHCILTCIQYALQDPNPKNELDDKPLLQEGQQQQVSDGDEDHVQHEQQPKDILYVKETQQGDMIRILVPQSSSSPPPVLPKSTPSAIKHTEHVLRIAAERILSGQDETVAILPIQQQHHDNGNDSDGDGDEVVGYGYHALPVTMLPPQSIVIPGSFNPPHTGHVALARAACRTAPCQVAWFELSITNADKPALQIDDVIQRCMGFLKLLYQQYQQQNSTEDNDRHTNMPEQWGILLTNAPLFVQKVNILQPLQVSRSYSVPSDEIPLHFVIGTDTLVRIVDPKYYNNSQTDMLRALTDMKCRFVVGGRLEQKKGGGPPPSSSPEAAEFVTGEDIVQALPSELQEKFTLLKDFRVDISSTELRRKLQQEQEQAKDQQLREEKKSEP